MALNIPNIKRVRDVIAGLPDERFDMRDLYRKNGEETHPTSAGAGSLVRECNTAACIAGWTVALLAPEEARAADAVTAMYLLGLDERQRGALFMPPGYHQAGRYSRAQAVAVLDHLIETGEVSWSDAPSRGQPATPMGRADAPGDVA